MVESDHPDSRFPIDILSLRRFLVRAQREVRLDGEVNVRITSSEEMHRLNREFRRKNNPTDVLSFPSSLNGKSEPAGDIAICAEIAYANAGALGHPLEEEFKVLILHGLLHLAGYNHETDQGEMARLEQRLRAKLKLPTTLIERALSAKTRAAASAASYVVPGAPGRVFGRKSQTLKVKKAAKHVTALANTARSEIVLGKGTTLEVAEKRSRQALGKGTTSVVPSKAEQDPNTSLPKAAAQRTRSGKKKSAPFSRTTRTSGAEAQKIIADSDGPAKAAAASSGLGKGTDSSVPSRRPGVILALAPEVSLLSPMTKGKPQALKRKNKERASTARLKSCPSLNPFKTVFPHTAKAVPFPEASRNDPHNFTNPAEGGRLSFASSSSLSHARPARSRP